MPYGTAPRLSFGVIAARHGTARHGTGQHGAAHGGSGVWYMQNCKYCGIVKRVAVDWEADEKWITMEKRCVDWTKSDSNGGGSSQMDECVNTLTVSGVFSVVREGNL
jgi:hypothetical protein